MNTENGLKNNNQDGIILPPRPENFKTTDWQSIDIKQTSEEPEDLVHIGGAEWTWSPAHSRSDEYYIHSIGNEWALWIRWLDENAPYDEEKDDYRYLWIPFVKGPKDDIDMKTAAIYMLIDGWEYDKLNERLYRPMMYSTSALLNIDEMFEIANVVWPEKKN